MNLLTVKLFKLSELEKKSNADEGKGIQLFSSEITIYHLYM